MIKDSEGRFWVGGWGTFLLGSVVFLAVATFRFLHFRERNFEC